MQDEETSVYQEYHIKKHVTVQLFKPIEGTHTNNEPQYKLQILDDDDV